MDGNGIEVVEFLAAALPRDDEVRLLEEGEVLGDGLTRHVVSLAQLAQGLPVPRMEAIQQSTPDRIGKRPEDCVHAHGRNMQLNDCIFKSRIQSRSSSNGIAD